MPGDSGDIAARSSIVQQRISIAGVIPVVVIGNNLRGQASARKSRAKVVFDKIVFVAGLPGHAGISVGSVERFILRGNRVERNAMGLVSLDEFDKIPR